MIRINIDLSEGKIQERTSQVRESLIKCLSREPLSIDGIELELGKLGLEEILKVVSIMDIETDAAIDYVRKGDTETASYLFFQAKQTKDFVYQRLLLGYGVVSEDGHVLKPMNESCRRIWADFITGKYDQKLKQCELVLGAASN